MMYHLTSPAEGHVFIGDSRELKGSRGALPVGGGLAQGRARDLRATGPHPFAQKDLSTVVTKSPYGPLAHTLLGSTDWLVSPKSASAVALGFGWARAAAVPRGRLNRLRGRKCKRDACEYCRKIREMST